VHPQGLGCPAKAVSGWRAVELASDMRESNIPTPREACPVSISGLELPFVCLLDNEHIWAELAPLTISQPKGEWLQSDRIDVRTTDRWEGDSREDLGCTEYEQGARRTGNRYNYLENAYIRALDDGQLGKHAGRIHEIVHRERSSLNAKPDAGHAKPLAQASTFAFYYPRHAEERIAKLVKLNKHRSVLTSDAMGRPVEFALYSKVPVTCGERRERKFWFRGKTLDELGFYQSSGLKPKPTSLPFDSVRCPEMFDWSDNDVPKALVEHWKGNPKTPPYGAVARLKPAFLAALQNSK
jgi:hypothetical protein